MPERLPSERKYPYSLKFLDRLDLRLTSQVVLFVGENGSGKSTLLEAVAALSRLPVGGGSPMDVGNSYAPEARTESCPGR